VRSLAERKFAFTRTACPNLHEKRLRIRKIAPINEMDQIRAGTRPNE
jgi:hypothetical protein